MDAINNKEDRPSESATNKVQENNATKSRSRLSILQNYKDTILNLCNQTQTYNEKVEKLLESLKFVILLIQYSKNESIDENILHWVVRCASRLVLAGDWSKIDQDKRNAIKNKIEEIIPKLGQRQAVIFRCEYILKNIENPWGNDKLLNVLRGDPWVLSESDMDYLTDERGCMILLRLQKLVETKCDSMAFAWSSKALRAYRAVNSGHLLKKSTSATQFSFIFEVYLCYLSKYGHVSEIIDEVKRLTVSIAPKLLNRFLKPNEELSRFEKYRQRIARLITQILLAKLMLEDLTEYNEKYYCDILKKWLHLYKSSSVAEFPNTARKLFMTALSRKHLYLASEMIGNMQVNEWRHLALELCVRGITGDLNELELLKSEKSVDENIVIQHEINLSARYVYLADLLKSHSHLAQECILTAFSLNPTQENYLLVKLVANQSNPPNSTSIEDSSKLQIKSDTPSPSISPINNQMQKQTIEKPLELLSDEVIPDNTAISADVSKESQETEIPMISQKPIRIIARYPPTESSATISKSDSTGNFSNPNEILLDNLENSERPDNNPLSAPSLILDSIELMDLPHHIRNDLSVLLNSPRLKILSWMLPWNELDMHCQKLLKTDCKLSLVRQSLAVANDRLQYLNLDYNQFKHLPESECPGIEKGYEVDSIDSDDEDDDDDDDDEDADDDDDDDYVSLSDDNFTPNCSMTSGKKRKKKPKVAKEKLPKPQKPLKEKLPKKPKKALKQPVKNIKEKARAINPYTLIRDANILSASQRAKEHEALMRALYHQQFQHQLQLSRSLLMLNQNTQVNRSFFLPYCPQLQERVQTERDVMPPPPTVPSQKTSRKSSPTNLQIKEPQLQFRMQQQLKSQAQLQLELQQYLQSQSQNQSQLSALIRSLELKPNPTLVKLAILQNISQKILLQQRLQQEQQNSSKVSLFANSFALAQQTNPTISIQRDIPTATVTSGNNASTTLPEATTSSSAAKLGAISNQPVVSKDKKITSTGNKTSRVFPTKKAKTDKPTKTKKLYKAPSGNAQRNENVQLKSIVRSLAKPTSSFLGIFPKVDFAEPNLPWTNSNIQVFNESSTESAPESLSATTGDSFSSDLVSRNKIEKEQVTNTCSNELILSNSNVQEEHNYFSKNSPTSSDENPSFQPDTDVNILRVNVAGEIDSKQVSLQTPDSCSQSKENHTRHMHQLFSDDWSVSSSESYFQVNQSSENVSEKRNSCQKLVEDWLRGSSGSMTDILNTEVKVSTSPTNGEEQGKSEMIKHDVDHEEVEINENDYSIIRNSISPIPPVLQNEDDTFYHELQMSETKVNRPIQKYQMLLTMDTLRTICEENNFDINEIMAIKTLPISLDAVPYIFKDKSQLDQIKILKKYKIIDLEKLLKLENSRRYRKKHKISIGQEMLTSDSSTSNESDLSSSIDSENSLLNRRSFIRSVGSTAYFCNTNLIGSVLRNAKLSVTYAAAAFLAYSQKSEQERRQSPVQMPQQENISDDSLHVNRKTNICYSRRPKMSKQISSHSTVPKEQKDTNKEQDAVLKKQEVVHKEQETVEKEQNAVHKDKEVAHREQDVLKKEQEVEYKEQEANKEQETVHKEEAIHKENVVHNENTEFKEQAVLQKQTLQKDKAFHKEQPVQNEQAAHKKPAVHKKLAVLKKHAIHKEHKKNTNDDMSYRLRSDVTKLRRMRRASTFNINYIDTNTSSDDDNVPLTQRITAKSLKRSKSVENVNSKLIDQRKLKSPKVERSDNVDQHLVPRNITSENSNTQNIIHSDFKLYGQVPIITLDRCDENTMLKTEETDEVIVLSSTYSDSDEVELISEEYIARPRRRTQMFKFRSSTPPKRVKKIYLKNIRSSKISIFNESSCSSPRAESELTELNESKATDKSSILPQKILAQKRRSTQIINSRKRRHSAFDKYLVRRLGSKSPAPKKQRSVSNPGNRASPEKIEASKPHILPELRLKKLDNLTMLRNNQRILVNGAVVVSPKIYLKRLKISTTPVKLSDFEIRKKRKLQKQTKRKNLAQHLQPIVKEELQNWNIQTRQKKSILRIDLKSDAAIPTNQWNNLDMFQVSSDDDSISESEPRKPTKIPRIDNKLTKNCNVTNAAIKEEHRHRTETRVEAIATKLIVETLVESEEKRKHLDQVLNDMINFWLPQVLTRQYLKQVTTKILFSIRNVLRKTISSVASLKNGCKMINETLEERTSKAYLNKKLFNSILTRSNEDKCISNKKLPTYYELRKMIYRRTLGEKMDNKVKPLDNIHAKFNNRKDPLSERLLCEVPGFCTLEYFTAPSFHCLPVVRIVHSTLPLDEKGNASAEASSSEAFTIAKNSAINQEAAIAQKATLVSLGHKQLNTPPGNHIETSASNVRVIIPHVSTTTTTTTKYLKPLSSTGVNSSTTFIKVDQNIVSDRKTRLEQNFVLLECNNSTKFVPIKKDDRFLLASTANRMTRDTSNSGVPQCRLIESTTLKSPPKINVVNEKFIVGSSSSNTSLLPVKFIYKSEGGMIHLTPVSGHTSIQNISLSKDIKAFSLVKADIKNAGVIDSVNSPLSIISTRSLYEENYAKFIQTSSASSTPLQGTAVVRTVVQQSSNLSESPSLVNESLPKFTQAFSKNIYDVEGYSRDETFSQEKMATKKIQINEGSSAEGNVLVAKENVTISNQRIGSVEESFTRNKTSCALPVTTIVAGAEQQVKIIQTNSNNSSVPSNTSLNGQRTTLLSPSLITAPIVSQASNSNYVQTRYVRPFFQISQNSFQTTTPQVLITTASHPCITTTSVGTKPNFSVNNLIVSAAKSNASMLMPNAAAKLKCLPTLTVTKCEKPLTTVEKKKPANVDNSTLEQLREFDLVFEQVKERSTTSTITTANAENDVGTAVEKVDTDSNTVINKPGGQQKNITLSDVNNFANIKKSDDIDSSRSITTQRNAVNFALFQKTPVVVVTNNLAQTKLLTSTPNIRTVREDKSRNEVRTTQATQTIQTSVSSTVPQVKFVQTKVKSTQKPTPCPLIPQTTTYNQKLSKPHEDEQTVQRIYDILAEYAEQLRNSPDLNNKPAPRRRSNPLNLCNMGSKKRKTLLQRPFDGSLNSNEIDQVMDSEDSSCGTSSLCNRSPIHDSSTSVDNSNHFIGQQKLIKTESVFAIVDGQNKICTGTNSTKVISSPQQQPAVNVINLGIIGNEAQSHRTTATKATAVFVPCKYILPLSAIKSDVMQFVEDKKIIEPSKQIMYKTRTVKVPDCLMNQKIAFRPIAVQNVQHPFDIVQSDQCSLGKNADESIQKTAIIFQSQPAFSTSIQQQQNPLNIIEVSTIDNIPTILNSQSQESVLELKQKYNRVQETSVITRANPAVKQTLEISKGEIDAKKQNTSSNKKANNTHILSTSPPSKTVTKLQKELTKKTSDKIKNNLRLDSSYKSTSSRILTQLNEGRKLALEREMKLQKSLSDECEDLGVGEPSTSDLFPEADLLFDPTASSFENNSQDEISTLVEEKASMPMTKDIKVAKKVITQFPVTNRESSSSIIKNSLCGDNLRSACLRQVIGWELPDASSGKTNLVIQHTSNSRPAFIQESTSPPPSTLVKMGNLSPGVSFGVRTESESEGEAVEGGGKRRISTRGIIKKSRNCPCCTSKTVLSSSTQTMSTIACPKDRAYLGKIRNISYQPLYTEMKRMRSIKVNNSGVMTEPIQGDLITPQHRINDTTSTIVTGSPDSVDNQQTTACSTRRVVMTNRYLKLSRR